MMEYIKELVNPNIFVGFLLVMIARMARIYHLAVIDMEKSDGQETVALLATTIGVCGFILGIILIWQQSAFWMLTTINVLCFMRFQNIEKERLRNMRS